MKVTFDRKLYSEEAIKKAYAELCNSEAKRIKVTSEEYIIELPESFDDRLHHFESMVLLYTIEEKRR
ncbi:MAG: hypothetical protein ACP5QK_10125 [Myxococcota bacterium]